MHPILFLINVTDPSSLPNILDPTFPLPVPSLLNLCLWAPPYLESEQEMQKHIYLRLLTWKCPSDGQRQWTWPLSEESVKIQKVRATRAAFAEIKNNLALPWPRLCQALRTRPAFPWSRSRRASLPSQSPPSILTILGNLVLDSACRITSQMW